MSGNAHGDRLVGWRADWAGLNAVVLGLGPIGFSAVDTLAELGARVTVLAAGGAGEYSELVRVVGADFRGVEGEAAADTLAALAPDIVIATPVYSPAHPAAAAARELGIPVWSDAELAWRLRDKAGEPAEWITVTGTTGAPRVALLAAAMLRADGRSVLPTGVGAPVLDAVRFPQRQEFLVVELSSLQLARTGHESAGRPAPLASLCLSAAEGAVGWHESVEDYHAALGRVYADTRVACVYSLLDSTTRTLVEDAEVQEGCRAVGVGLGVPGPSDLGIVDGLLVDRAFLEDRRTRAVEIGTLDELALLGVSGPGPVLEVLAAAALAGAAGVDAEAVARGVAAEKP